jgi:hypothetical protein
VKHAAYLLTLAPLFGVTSAFAQGQGAPTPAAPTAAPAELAPAPAEVAPAPAEPAPAFAEPVPALAPAAPVEVAPAAAAPAADAPEPASLELFGSLAPTIAHGEPANPGLTNSFRRVGVYAEAGVAYRSKYFLDPFISAGYATLASGDTTLPDDPDYGPGGTLHQHLGVWLLSPGVTSDIWRFRLRVGIGLAIVKQSFRFHGENSTSTQLPFAFEAGLAYNFYQLPRFRLDAEARFVQAKGADVSFWTLGLTGRGDLITF